MQAIGSLVCSLPFKLFTLRFCRLTPWEINDRIIGSNTGRFKLIVLNSRELVRKHWVRTGKGIKA